MKRRARRRPENRHIYKLCSLMLCYPDEELLSARAELSGTARELSQSPGAGALERFCRW